MAANYLGLGISYGYGNGYNNSSMIVSSNQFIGEGYDSPLSKSNETRQKLRTLHTTVTNNGTDNKMNQYGVKSTISNTNSLLKSMQNYGESLKTQRQKTKDTTNSISKLKYQFKNISSKIMRSKTSANARQVAGQASREVLRLKRQRQNADVDEEELEAAITHAKAMERIAKKKVKHLEAEEMAKASGIEGNSTGPDNDKTNGYEESDEKLYEDERDEDYNDNLSDKSEEAIDSDLCSNNSLYTQFAENFMEIEDNWSDNEISLSLDEMNTLMSDMLEDMSEGMKDMLEEMGFGELTESMDAMSGDMDPAKLKMMKIKHRNKEMKDMVKADADYLKVVFDRMQKGQGNSVNLGIANSNNTGGSMMSLSGSVGGEVSSCSTGITPVINITV